MRHVIAQKSQHKPTARSGWTKQKYVNNDVQYSNLMSSRRVLSSWDATPRIRWPLGLYGW